jgi:hypothetical protein
MKATELIEKLAKEINEHGDSEVYLWNQMLMKHNPIEDLYFVNDEMFDQDLDDEDYAKDFHNIYHNIVIN